ncbi:MAG: DEAD/DEAH box helicase family protein, partial [Paludibacter sp.]|nr:DEAD/DEAH box helicase family protein [Paludibacter sp.]
MKYVDVVVPLPVSGTFTYVVPSALDEAVRIGMRVVVPFGNKKLYTGIITFIHSLKPTLYEPKEILSLLDTEPVLRRPQYKFWEWISEYYMAHIGEVYQAAVPSGLKLESETEVCINPDFEAATLLSEKEQQLLDVLSAGKPLTIAEINKVCASQDVMPTVKRLLDKGAVEVNEYLAAKFRAKSESCVHLTEAFLPEDQLKSLFDVLSKAPKQLELLMRYIELSNCLRKKDTVEVFKKDLLNKSGISPAVLTTMIEKGIFEISKKEIGRLDYLSLDTVAAYTLNDFQEKALQEIEKQFIEKQVVLLHGVTSSGKTELYTHLINKVLASGRQVLYLVPEIALTTQLTTRLKRVFGNKLGVYHSKFSDSERVEIWNNVLHNQSYEVILGVRSSIFLPFRHLGLVIVD